MNMKILLVLLCFFICSAFAEDGEDGECDSTGWRTYSYKNIKNISIL